MCTSMLTSMSFSSCTQIRVELTPLASTFQIYTSSDVQIKGPIPLPNKVGLAILDHLDAKLTWSSDMLNRSQTSPVDTCMDACL